MLFLMVVFFFVSFTPHSYSTSIKVRDHIGWQDIKTTHEDSQTKGIIQESIADAEAVTNFKSNLISPFTAGRNNFTEKMLSVSPGKESRIIEGVPVEKGAFPFMVKLKACGGTLIKPSYVLTAAHCTFQKNIVNSVVNINTVNLTDPRKISRTIVKVVTHKLYEKLFLHPVKKIQKESKNYDIALLLLNKPVDEISAQTVQLGGVNDHNLPLMGYVAGWGRTSLSCAKSNSHILRLTQLKIITNEECKKKLRKISMNQMCTESVCCGNDVCRGDSGGPLMVIDEDTYEVTQVGIISRGFLDYDGSNLPSFYIRINHFIDWINENTR